MNLPVCHCIMHRFPYKLDTRMCHDRNCYRFLTLDRLADPFFHIQFAHNFSFYYFVFYKDEPTAFL